MKWLFVSISVFLAIDLLIFVLLYNRLVRLRNKVREGWSGIEVQLKRRHGLIPSLVNVVKGYASHERTVLEEVTAERAAASWAAAVADGRAGGGFACYDLTLAPSG